MLPAVTTTASDAPAPPIPVKIRQPSRRLRQALGALIDGTVKTKKAAAELAGLNYEHFVKQTKKDHIRVFIERGVRRNLTDATMLAGARLVELINAGSEHVSLDASRHVLALDGIKPAADAQVSVNIDLKAGYVIDLREPEDRMKVVGPISNGSD